MALISYIEGLESSKEVTGGTYGDDRNTALFRIWLIFFVFDSLRPSDLGIMRI